MAQLSFTRSPNVVAGRVVAEATTAWRVLGIHYTGNLPVITGYATIAALLAAGDKCWPGLEGGCDLSSCTIETDTGAGVAGAGVYFAVNFTDAAPPTTDTAQLVLGGVTFSDTQVHNMWISKVTAGDRVLIRGRY